MVEKTWQHCRRHGGYGFVSDCIQCKRGEPVSSANVKLETIATIVQSWIHYAEQEHKKENIPFDEDTHIRTFPVYPTVGTLQNWIKVLRNG